MNGRHLSLPEKIIFIVNQIDKDILKDALDVRGNNRCRGWVAMMAKRNQCVGGTKGREQDQRTQALDTMLKLNFVCVSYASLLHIIVYLKQNENYMSSGEQLERRRRYVQVVMSLVNAALPRCNNICINIYLDNDQYTCYNIYFYVRIFYAVHLILLVCSKV